MARTLRRAVLARPKPIPTQAETTAWLARLTVQPTADQTTRANRLIYRIKQAGIWSRFDIIEIPVAGNEQASQQNLKQNLYNAVPASAPVWNAATGCYRGNGAGTLGYGLNLSTAIGLNAKQDDMSVSWWPLSGDAATSYIGGVGNIRLPGIVPTANAGGIFGAGSARLSSITTRATGSVMVQPYDLHTLSRSDAAFYTHMLGGVGIATWPDVSSAFENANFAMLGNPAIGNLVSTAPMAFFALGAALTKAQHIQLRSAVREYLMTSGLISDTSVRLTNNSSGFSMIDDVTKTAVTNNASQPHSFVKDGNYCRMVVKAGDQWPNDPQSPPDRQRSELYFAYLWGAAAADVWGSVRMRVPSDCEQLTPNLFGLPIQAHAVDTVLNASPPWSLIFGDNAASPSEQEQIKILWDTVANNPPAFNAASLYQSGAPAPRDRLLDYVWRLRLKQDGTAICQVWRNKVQVVNRADINMGYAVDATGVYFKLGFYRGLSTITSAIEFWNFELSASTLLDRVANPLPIA